MAMNLMMLLTFRIFRLGWVGQTIVLTSLLQHPKLFVLDLGCLAAIVIVESLVLVFIIEREES
jgi:hypothetical protein